MNINKLLTLYRQVHLIAQLGLVGADIKESLCKLLNDKTSEPWAYTGPAAAQLRWGELKMRYGSQYWAIAAVLLTLAGCSQQAQDLYKVEIERSCQNCTLQGLNLAGQNLSAKYRVPLRNTPLSTGPEGLNRAAPVDLTGSNLRRANLSNADLFEVVLNQTNLREADLSGANLNAAQLVEADLSGANLQNARLQDANLQEANLTRADLSDANFEGADLTGADLTDALTAGATGLEK